MDAKGVSAPVAGGSFLIRETKPGDVFAPEAFTDEHRLIAQTARDFAEREIIPNLDRIRRDGHPDEGGAVAEWPILSALRREAVYLERVLRRPVQRVRQSRRGPAYLLPRGSDHAGRLGGRRGAQDGRPWVLDRVGLPGERPGAGRERPGRGRAGL